MAETSTECEHITDDEVENDTNRLIGADEGEHPACTKEASSIQAIDKVSVHRICSGQVVLTLATAVKELLENSIDAGATHVEIRLKDCGSDCIEVADNGSGVDEKDFEGLTLKHYTSKLENFDDLVNVTSFGFRGEALSSLCALSNMVITTRHKSAAVGTRLEFDLSGRIISRKSAPRQTGTTVQVHNIFHSLPVRHKEFHRNLKKEYARLVQVLNAYCLINTRVRISCSNQTLKGSRSTVVSTNGNESVRENIANIFGPKQVQSLLEFRQVEPDDDICSEFGIKSCKKPAISFRIEGFVSKCEHGQGRSSTDRQFIFINGRPCDHAKIVKLINEVYHSYNRHQNPFVAISIFMDKDTVDVNVTPDKRQIFLEGENLLLASLKTSLIQMFEPTTSVYKVNNSLMSCQSETKAYSMTVEHRSSFQEQSVFLDSSSPSLSSSLSRLKRSFSSAFARNDSAGSIESVSPGMKSRHSSMANRKSNSFPSQSASSDRGSITQFFTRFSPVKSTSACTLPSSLAVADASSDIYSTETSQIQENARTLNMSTSQEVASCDDSSAGDFCPDVTNHCQQNADKNDLTLDTRKTETSNMNEVLPHCENVLADSFDSKNHTCGDDDNYHLRTEDSKSPRVNIHIEYLSGKNVEDKLLTSISLNSASVTAHSRVDSDIEIDLCEESKIRNNSMMSCEDQNFVTDLDMHLEGEVVHKREQAISFNLSALRKKMLSNVCGPGSSHFYRNFRAKICPSDNRSAEDELQKEISKDMFEKMEVVGQFNLGFIIVKLGSDLFIVDQHATDEKYNFEMLQRNTSLQSQKMIVPQNLELTSSNETILMDNLEVFRKNGFDFLIEPEALPTQRVKLVSAPVSKNWSFGKDDIEELLFMLADSPNVMCWPSRVRMMFASRACRKSVMIGTALNKREMKKLICHMGQIEQPWNCPHGRPTMRHLFNMDMLPSTDVL